MKYEASFVEPLATSAVLAHPACEKSDLAIRHAKAFIAVVEAAKKTERLRKKSNDGKEAERAWWRACDAESVAVLALTRIEREVRRAAVMKGEGAMKYQIRVRNESGDDFGKHTFPEKPTRKELKAFLLELSPGDFVDGSRGPGEFGSYLHVEEVTPRGAARKEKGRG